MTYFSDDFINDFLKTALAEDGNTVKPERPKFNFGPASKDETSIYGSSKPEHSYNSISAESIQEWVDYVKSQGISGVLCLLEKHSLDMIYKMTGVNLIDRYRKEFGNENVMLAPVPDFSYISRDTFTKSILPFLKKFADTDRKVVVHCAGGIGRTGQILAAWLTHGRGYDIEDAIDAVKMASPALRNPQEAGIGYFGEIDSLRTLLDVSGNEHRYSETTGKKPFKNTNTYNNSDLDKWLFGIDRG